MSPLADLILELEDLRKSFTLHAVGGRVVPGLRGVDLQLRCRRHMALTGASGAGKSTLLKCVYRTYRPDSGRILWHHLDHRVVDMATLPDSDVADLREHEIGYVSQFLRAEPRRGVLDAVTRAARRTGVGADEAEEAAVGALRRLNIEERLWGVYPTLLSGGEKQRVNLAAAVAIPPRLLLLDEPASALDAVNREAALDLISELTGRGAAVLSVFHDEDAVARLADDVVVLHGGRVMEEAVR